MKYYDMHDECYENLARKGKVSWDGIDSVEKILQHESNIGLSKRIDHYFPDKEAVRAVDFGCGTGTMALFLANLGFDVTGFDVSSKAIEMAKENARSLGFRANFEVADLMTLQKRESELTVDSSLLHCLVDNEHREKFYQLCSDLTFIHTMIESDDMSQMLDKEHFSFVDSILWSTGPDRWDMDWHDIDGRKMFKHRRILSKEDFLTEVDTNGFDVLEYEMIDQGKNPHTFVGWIRRRRD